MSTLWPVKKEGGWRPTVDFRALNRCTPSITNVVAKMPDMMTALKPSAKVYSSIDISNGYFSIPVHEDSQYKLAFTFQGKQYAFCRLAQGFKSSSTYFHICMVDILKTFSEPECIIQYVDDILLQTETKEQHYALLEELLTLTENAGLKLNPKKAQLMKDSVCFLGVIVSQGGRTPDPNKCETIRKLPRPSTKTALRQFLGMVGFCRDFTEGFAEKAKPLYDFLKGDKKETDPLDRLGEHEQAFTKLKVSLLQARP